MSILKSLAAWLKADDDVAGIVGDRVFPQAGRKGSSGAFPRITYSRVSGKDILSHDGPSGTAWIRVQINCFSYRYDDCDSLANAIRGTRADPKLNGYTGTLGDYTVQGIFFENEVDLYWPPEMGEEGLHQTAVDFVVWYVRN